MAFSYEIECPSAVTSGLRGLLFSNKFSDLTILVENSRESVPAHRQILAACSPVFESMLYGPFVEGATNEVLLTGVDLVTLKSLLQFIYTGSLSIDLYNLVPLIEAAGKYCITAAKSELYKAASKIIDVTIVSSDILEKIAFIMTLSFNCGIDQILEMCLEYIDINIREFVLSDVFLEMPLELLELVMKRDTLYDGFFEVQIYLACLRWARGTGDVKETHLPNFEVNNIDAQRMPLLLRMLAHIRFPQIKAHFIIKDIEPTHLVSKDTLYVALAYQAAPHCYTADPSPEFQERVGSKRPWVWSEEKIGPHIVLSHDKKSAIAHHYDWEKVLGKSTWFAGLHEFSVFLEMNIAATSNSWQIIVGLANPCSNLHGHLGSDTDEWGLACYAGHKISGRDKREEYATPSKRGDTITGRVDLKHKTLEFLRNGHSLGIAYQNIQGPVIPAISLLKGQKVTLVFES